MYMYNLSFKQEFVLDVVPEWVIILTVNLCTNWWLRLYWHVGLPTFPDSLGISLKINFQCSDEQIWKSPSLWNPFPCYKKNLVFASAAKRSNVFKTSVCAKRYCLVSQSALIFSASSPPGVSDERYRYCALPMVARLETAYTFMLGILQHMNYLL